MVSFFRTHVTRRLTQAHCRHVLDSITADGFARRAGGVRVRDRRRLRLSVVPERVGGQAGDSNHLLRFDSRFQEQLRVVPGMNFVTFCFAGAFFGSTSRCTFMLHSAGVDKEEQRPPSFCPSIAPTQLTRVNRSYYFETWGVKCVGACFVRRSCEW